MHKESSYPQFPLALILTALCAITTHAQEAKVVDFPDKNLEAAIRKAINKPTGDILQTDLVGTGFTDFMAPYKDITDLTGLEHCADLTYVHLDENQISDISALASLTNLEFLLLHNNQVSDVNALGDLTNLRLLVLSQNQISDIAAVANLPNLEYLGLEGNQLGRLEVWIAKAGVACRRILRPLGPTGVTLLIAGVTLFVAVLVVLRVWSRRVSKRYTREP